MAVSRRNQFIKRLTRQWVLQSHQYKRYHTLRSRYDKQLERQVQLIVVLFMAGMVLGYLFGIKTLLSWWQISRFYALLAVLAYFIPKAILPTIYKRFAELKILLAVFGLAPFLTGLLLTINYGFADTPFTEHYKVTHAEYFVSDQIVEIELEKHTYQSFYELRRVPMPTQDIFTPDSAIIYAANGAFGIAVYKKVELIP